MLGRYGPLSIFEKDWLLDVPTVALMSEDSRQDEERPPSGSQCLS